MSLAGNELFKWLLLYCYFTATADSPWPDQSLSWFPAKTKLPPASVLVDILPFLLAVLAFQIYKLYNLIYFLLFSWALSCVNHLIFVLLLFISVSAGGGGSGQQGFLTGVAGSSGSPVRHSGSSVRDRLSCVSLQSAVSEIFASYAYTVNHALVLSIVKELAKLVYLTQRCSSTESRLTHRDN